jgi:protease I
VADIILQKDGRLTDRRVAVLMETDYVEHEIDYYRRRFAEEGARVDLITRLWGAPELTFQGHEHRLPITVDGDLEALDDKALRGYDALIVPSGMVSDRLRYAETAGDLAPAVRLLSRAFAEPSLLKGIICHGMWLVSPIAEAVRDRALTCHHNLVSDVRHMGARYTDQDIVVDRDLVTARSADHCHLFARTLIELIAARTARRDIRLRRSTPAWKEPHHVS